MKAKRTAYGVIDFDWNTRKIILPLDKAHQVQALLTQAMKLTDDYRSAHQRFYALSEYDAPSVSVLDNNCPMFDATELSKEEYNEWHKTVDEALRGDDTYKAKDIVPPAVWASMKGE